MLELLVSGLLSTPEASPLSSTHWNVAPVILRHASEFIGADTAVFLSVLRIDGLATLPPLMVSSVLESLHVVLERDNESIPSDDIYSDVRMMVEPALRAARRGHRTLGVRVLSSAYHCCQKNVEEQKLPSGFIEVLLASCRDEAWQVRLEAISALEKVLASHPGHRVSALFRCFSSVITHAS
jgi:hypothetical protein